MTFDLLIEIRSAVDEAIDHGWDKARILKDLRDAVAEVIADDEIPGEAK